jgi:hypothetical protein
VLVQLPNGKTVNMSIEQYLALNEEDIQYMISINCGSTASSPWCGSVVKKPGRMRIDDEDPDEDVNTGLSEDELDLDEEAWDPQDTADPEAPEIE